MKQLLTLLTALLISSFSIGQKAAIYFLNGPEYLPLNQQIIENSTANTFGNYSYKLLYFNQPLSAKHQEKLKNQGIELLEYLPKYAYIAGFPTLGSTQNLNYLPAFGTANLLPQHKLSKALYEQDYPDHAVQGNTILVNLVYFKTINPATIHSALLLGGYEIIQEFPNTHSVQLAAPIAKIKSLVQLPFVQYLEEIDPLPEVENRRGVTSHRSNHLYNLQSNTRRYNGEGVVIAMGDDGFVDNHIDFKGRVDNSTSNGNNGDHGDHVAGTITGAGNKDPEAQGMAWGAYLYSYSYWDGINAIYNIYNSQNVRITSQSLSNGCNAGYTSFARRADESIYDMPEVMHVFSSGNDGTSDCGYGAGAGWGNITGGVKVGKNVLTVGNLTFADVIANSSSRGPAHDGRIKPEVTAVGTDVYSTIENNDYDFKTGTSMACPGVSGVFAQLIHAYKDLNNNQEPNSALIKSTLMNTADDLGNFGPDYEYGFGRINGKRAIEVLENQQYFSNSIQQGEAQNYTIPVPDNVRELKVMVYWADAPATNNASVALVNDLDARITANGTTHLPWKLSTFPAHDSLDAPATKGFDHINNVEQISIVDPQAGNYDLTVNGFNIPVGPQEYFVIYSYILDGVRWDFPIGGENFAVGDNEYLRWEAYENTSNFLIQFSKDSGATWQNLANAYYKLRLITFNPNQNHIGKLLFAISRDGFSDTIKVPVNVAPQPTNLQVDAVCGSNAHLTWNPVANAKGYILYAVGQNYMDSVGYSTTNSGWAKGINTNETQWYSIAAVDQSGAVSKRTIAISNPPGEFNCSVVHDLELSLISPLGGPASCASNTELPVEVQVTNKAPNNAFGATVNYQLNNQTVVSEQLPTTLLPNETITYSFNQKIIPTSGNNHLKVWVNYNLDPISTNDTAYADLSIYASQSYNFPVLFDFESQNLCIPNSSCNNVCDLQQGFNNAQNQLVDDLNWLVHSGTTATPGTGPTADHTTNGATGKYLYVEVGSCYESSALLYTPCINLTGANNPVAEFYVHSFGSSTPTLTVDVWANNTWNNTVIAPIAINQNNWVKYQIPLNQWINQSISLRFNATTGTNAASDIALDDLEFKEATAAPIVNFTADSTLCVGQNTQLFAAIQNGAQSVNWSISPNTFNYLTGNATSLNPVIQFTATGAYTVELSATNAFGTNTALKTNYITVSGGPQTLPLTEDFESGNYGILSTVAQGSTFWTNDSTTGVTGTPTRALMVNNFQSNDKNLDILSLNGIDLSTLQNVDVLLSFDVAAAQPTYSTDELQWLASTNCGETFQLTSYTKSGTVLQTTSPKNFNWQPTLATHWRRDTVNLSHLVGYSVDLQLVNNSNNGNNIFIDNLEIVAIARPKAQFSANSEICVNTATTVQDLSFNAPTAVNWNFGVSAQPQTATGAGNKTIQYNLVGPKTINQTVQGTNGYSNSYQQLVQVVESPSANFTSTNDSTYYSFTANSTYGAYSWYINDSMYSTSPTLNYQFVEGTYTVRLEESNVCGTNSSSQTIQAVGLAELTTTNNLESIRVYPNPSSNGRFIIDLSDSNTQQIEIYSLAGALIYKAQRAENQSTITIQLNTSKGLYVIKAIGSNTVHTAKILVE